MTHTNMIRSMSDEELALTVMCPNETGHAEIVCAHDESCNCRKCCLEWLQQEVKTCT